MASKSLTKYALTWKEGKKKKKNSSTKWFLLPKPELSVGGCYNLTNTQGRQVAGLAYALGISDDVGYSGKQYSTF